MWFKRFSNYLLANRPQAIAFAFVSTLLGTYLLAFLRNAPLSVVLLGVIVVMFLVTIGIVLAGLVTLMKSELEGAEIALAATLPHLIAAYYPLTHDAITPFVLLMSVGVAVLSNVLTWIFAVMLRQKTSWSSLLQIAALAAVLTVSVVHLVKPNIAQWWTEQISTQTTLSMNALEKSLNPPAMVASSTVPATTAKPIKNAELLENLQVASQFITGILCVTLLLSALSQLIVARWWQAAISAPGLLRTELHSIRLSPLTGLLFGLSLVFSYLGNRVVLDIMPIIYALLCVAGLSVVHYMFRLIKSKTAMFWLFVFYISLLFVGSFSAFLLAMIALLDIWLDLRKRITLN